MSQLKRLDRGIYMEKEDVQWSLCMLIGMFNGLFQLSQVTEELGDF